MCLTSDSTLGALEPLCSSQPPEVLDLLLQVVSSVGPLKLVVLDSVSAVIYPLLGGRQSEGELGHCGCQEAAELILKSLFHPCVLCLEWGLGQD